jgi:hypothetical protein
MHCLLLGTLHLHSRPDRVKYPDRLLGAMLLPLLVLRHSRWSQAWMHDRTNVLMAKWAAEN